MKTIDAKTALRGLLVLVALVIAGASFTTFTSRRAAAKSSPLFVEVGQDAIQFTGYPVVGSRVYYFLDSGPNMGKARPAIVVRAHSQDPGPGQLVDLVVFETPDDIAPSTVIAHQNPLAGETILFAPRSPGIREPGHWDWMVPSSTGF